MVAFHPLMKISLSKDETQGSTQLAQVHSFILRLNILGNNGLHLHILTESLTHWQWSCHQSMITAATRFPISKFFPFRKCPQYLSRSHVSLQVIEPHYKFLSRQSIPFRVLTSLVVMKTLYKIYKVDLMH